MRLKLLLTITLCSGVLARAQSYHDFRERYDNFDENDTRAFQHIKPYIAKAKAERDYAELAQAYKDAVYFSPDSKLSYADSMIATAARTRDKDLMARAYLTKGTVYYFSYRKFGPALDEYMKAWKFAQNSRDRYLHFKTLYHIGVMKTYLGYYDDALSIFNACHRFFSQPEKHPESPNARFNRRKGYLNTLHRIGVCLLHLSRTDEAEKTVSKGLAESTGADFGLERSYFYKLQGIVCFRQQNYAAALTALRNAQAGLGKNDDWMNATLVYYYQGLCHERMGYTEKAMADFARVDSVFGRYRFVLPETRPAFEYLIARYTRENDKDRALHYTTRLLEADRVIAEDFRYLSPKIHRAYDAASLLAVKEKLEKSVLWACILSGVLMLPVAGMVFLFFRNKKRRRQSKVAPQQALVVSCHTMSSAASAQRGRARTVPDAVAEAVLARLEALEKDRFYLQPRMSLQRLAPLLKTNTSYLSRIIREYRGCHFNDYLRHRRIDYLTEKLIHDRKWRNYSIDTLATECGFLDRKTFSRAFVEYHGLKPLEFIRRLPTTQP